MVAKLSTFWSFRSASTAMLIARAHREGRAIGGVAGGERHQRRHAEQRDDGLVGGGLGIGGRLAEVPAQVVVAADPLAVDEGLRRGLDPMLGLEGVCRL